MALDYAYWLMVGCDDEVVVYKPNKKHTNY